MRLLGAISVLGLALAVVSGGAAPFGRVLMAVGLPGLAVPFFAAPEWRGAAYYRAGQYGAAVERFAEAQEPFNLGNAEAHRGRHAAALEAFDLARARGHPRAQANFDVVAAYYAGLGIDPAALGLFPERKEGPEMEGFVARGDGRAAGTGDAVTNSTTMLGLAELQSRGRLGVRRVFDDKFMVADARWLAQLADVPGDYMAARIAEEHKRRVKAGLAPPPPEDPR
ncbi:hypothetical protein [Roseobacter sinensis]|uniref:Sel1 repeat family protein n=1 Tax=Roseobacter sinensis TaxID=2931391 RepID=A0ABT3BKF4_9RHOB|nr:hypothetical protein [Roseobacter sp. WL0113]MCV3274057.1 hypothetical protein [Roseobacter sp. WL0113]